MDVNYELTIDYLVNFNREISLSCQRYIAILTQRK